MAIASYAEALSFLRARAASCAVRTENLALGEAVGRVAAEDLVSQESLPPFANSAVDGFAVRSSETPGRLRGLGMIAAGDPPVARKDNPRSCWEIMTGAPMPPGFDAAVKIEDVVKALREGLVEIEVPQVVAADENVREAGEDFRPGMTVLSRGTRLRPEHVLACAALGIERVSVRARPRVAIISTGKELAHEGAPSPGRIRNSTAPFLLSALAELGAEASFAGLVGDEPAEFLALFGRVLSERPDVVLTTGAVSMGKHDFIPTALRDLGAEIAVHKLPIRPGKPILLAAFREGGPAVFGLPGNPVSTAVGARFFVEPYLRAWQGSAAERPFHAKLAAGETKPAGTRVFLKATLDPESGEARALPGQASFRVSPLVEATGWIVLPEGRESFAAGEQVEFFPQRSACS